ncbi:cytochrome P450 [Streptomyces eurocidicus]|uniref:Cytochrome P450 n=1 Tax=Streptomyces eurocidicus TaxID=66423 RepID=A0A2N8NQH0_STREU|nr:cytochrome P450 [Streptomyces eurocidicus]MBF6055294.1 cytochrome P450 [Streptomyces eurocidicus]PNE31013.1 cytochrome P450 [Streptomyces eurocidicus]
MTLPPEHPRADAMVVPPPQCPAHGPGGATRLYGPEAEADPMGLYERLREKHGQVAPVLLHGDVPAWLVLGYRENLDVARTPSRFSRDSRLWREAREGRIAPDHPLTPITTWQPICVFADGQQHERWRGAVNDGIARFDKRGIRRHVTRFANELVDRFCQEGRADLVHQFAEHLPMMAMTQLLGMPEAYDTRLVNAARDMIKGTETAVASNEFVQETLRKLVARKRLEPGSDFTSWLLEHPSGLTDDEVQQHLRLVLIAAYETTANLIANTLKMVFTDVRFRASLAGGHMTLPDAVEQVLWDEPPFITILGRWATQDTELAGQQIREGDALVLGLAAANMDTVVRPDPDLPIHGNRSHLAFSGGAHECPGQDVGRAIADTGIDALLLRLPDLTLAVEESELVYASALMSRHLMALPVKFAAQPPLPPEPAGDRAPEGPASSVQPERPEQPVATPAPSGQVAPSRTPWWRSLLRRLRRG